MRFLVYLSSFINYLGFKKVNQNKITGTWDVYYYGMSQPSATLVLREKKRLISGTSTVIENTRGERVNRSYIYNGFVLDKSIILTFKDISNSNTFGGSMVFFVLDSDFMSMKGTTIYYKPEINEVVKIDAFLVKKGAPKEVYNKMKNEKINSFYEKDETKELTDAIASDDLPKAFTLLAQKFQLNTKAKEELSIIRGNYEEIKKNERTQSFTVEAIRTKKNKIADSLLKLHNSYDTEGN